MIFEFLRTATDEDHILIKFIFIQYYKKFPVAKQNPFLIKWQLTV